MAQEQKEKEKLHKQWAAMRASKLQEVVEGTSSHSDLSSMIETEELSQAERDEMEEQRIADIKRKKALEHKLHSASSGVHELTQVSPSHSCLAAVVGSCADGA